MSESYVGEIRMFAGNFAPEGWVFCEGQELLIQANDELFALIGITYGGDGKRTFALPDLRGRIPIHMGQGPGLSNRSLGQKGGSENVTLSVDQMPSHGHGPLAATLWDADRPQVSGKLSAKPQNSFYSPTSPTAAFHAASIANVGGSQSHTNMMPYLCVNFIICLDGIFPTQ